MSIYDIEVTTTIPAPHEAHKRVNDGARRVMREYGKLLVQDWKNRWVGWKYEGRARKWPRNVSRKEWRSKVIPSDRGIELQVTNQARDFRGKNHSYVEVVHRAGADTHEWIVIRGQQKGMDDDFRKRLTDAVLAAAFVPTKRRRVGPSSGGASVTGPTVVL